MPPGVGGSQRPAASAADPEKGTTKHFQSKFKFGLEFEFKSEVALPFFLKLEVAFEVTLEFEFELASSAHLPALLPSSVSRGRNSNSRNMGKNTR